MKRDAQGGGNRVKQETLRNISIFHNREKHKEAGTTKDGAETQEVQILHLADDKILCFVVFLQGNETFHTSKFQLFSASPTFSDKVTSLASTSKSIFV